MENTPMEKYTAGFGLSLVVTSLLNAIILVIKEKNDSVMSAMKAALGHHWTTHGAIVIVVFLVLGFIFSGLQIGTKIDSRKMLTYIIWAVIISGVIIAGFFLPNLKFAGAMKY
jgi:protein-S-isoprenylcysteine O-methyltransferase Ste14